MAYIRVKDRVTGQIGRLPEEDLQSYPGRYEVIGTPTGGGNQGFVQRLAQPFTNTAQRVGGAGESLMRLLLANQAEKALEQGDYDKAQRLGQVGGRESALTRGERPQLTDPTQIAKDSAALLSYGVPVSKFAKPAVGGAAAGALGGFGYSEPGKELQGTATGAVTGAATAAILNKLFPGKAAASGERGRLGDTGMELKRWVERPQAGAGVKSIGAEDDIINYLRSKGITGSPNAMRGQIENLYDDLYKQVGQVLDDAPAKEYSKATVKKWITNRLREEGTYYVPGQDKALDDLVDTQVKLLMKKGSGGKITPQQIYSRVGELGKDLTKTYAKAKGESAAGIVPREGALMDFREALLSLFRDIGPEEIQPLTQEMSMLHRAAPGLKQASLETFNIFGYPIPGAGTVQAAQNKAGDALLAADEFTRGARSTTPALQTAVGGKAPATASALTSFLQGGTQPAEQPAQQPAQQPQEGGLGLSQQDLALLSLLPAKEQTKILSKIIEERIVGGGEESDSEFVKRTASEARQMLEAGSINTGMLAGALEGLKQKVSAGDPETLTFFILIDNLRAKISKIRAGSALTPTEEKRLDQYTPSRGDSYQELLFKLRGLETLGL